MRVRLSDLTFEEWIGSQGDQTKTILMPRHQAGEREVKDAKTGC